jgi:type IV pilus assembly protein PilV
MKMMRHFQLGFSMIEVLVTLVIMAGGALGLAGMQIASVKYNAEASVRSKATLLAIELSDRMRANMAGVSAANYDRNLGYTAALAAAVAAPGCGTASDCTAATLAQLDLNSWLDSIGKALPGGTGAVVPVTGNRYARSIVVMWKEKSLNDSGATDPFCTNTAVVGVRCYQTTFMP